MSLGAGGKGVGRALRACARLCRRAQSGGGAVPRDTPHAWRSPGHRAVRASPRRHPTLLDARCSLYADALVHAPDPLRRSLNSRVDVSGQAVLCHQFSQSSSAGSVLSPRRRRHAGGPGWRRSGHWREIRLDSAQRSTDLTRLAPFWKCHDSIRSQRFGNHCRLHGRASPSKESGSASELRETRPLAESR